MLLPSDWRREQIEAIARHIMTPSPIMVRMMDRIAYEEAQKWLAGKTDVCIGTAYVQHGWGDDDPPA